MLCVQKTLKIDYETKKDFVVLAVCVESAVLKALTVCVDGFVFWNFRGLIPILGA